MKAVTFFALFLMVRLAAMEATISFPTIIPSAAPSAPQSSSPSVAPVQTNHPTRRFHFPTHRPTFRHFPTHHPTRAPTRQPSAAPTSTNPTPSPTPQPSEAPITSEPTPSPSENPSYTPTTVSPTAHPTHRPTERPTRRPTDAPTERPTRKPTLRPTRFPTASPTEQPTTVQPTSRPSSMPTDGGTPFIYRCSEIPCDADGICLIMHPVVIFECVSMEAICELRAESVIIGPNSNLTVDGDCQLGIRVNTTFQLDVNSTVSAAAVNISAAGDVIIAGEINTSDRGPLVGPGSPESDNGCGGTYGGTGGRSNCNSEWFVNFDQQIGSIEILNDVRESVADGGPTWGSGGGFPGCGRGGGRIIIISNSSLHVQDTGVLMSNGGQATAEGKGAGSGGSILILVNSFLLDGFISAAGGGFNVAGSSRSGGGGGGRVAAFARESFDLDKILNSTYINIAGGSAMFESNMTAYACQNGGGGSVYVQKGDVITDGRHGTAIISNSGIPSFGATLIDDYPAGTLSAFVIDSAVVTSYQESAFLFPLSSNCGITDDDSAFIFNCTEIFFLSGSYVALENTRHNSVAFTANRIALSDESYIFPAANSTVLSWRFFSDSLTSASDSSISFVNELVVVALFTVDISGPIVQLPVPVRILEDNSYDGFVTSGGYLVNSTLSISADLNVSAGDVTSVNMQIESESIFVDSAANWQVPDEFDAFSCHIGIDVDDFKCDNNFEYDGSILSNGTFVLRAFHEIVVKKDAQLHAGAILVCAPDIFLRSGAEVSSHGGGCRPGDGTGKGKSPTGKKGGGGGGYGGEGGDGADSDGSGGREFATDNLLSSGSGGGCAIDATSSNAADSSGGGIIVIFSEETLEIDGNLESNGGSGYSSSSSGGCGGGSGGTIYIEAHGVSGEGSIKANGGAGGSSEDYPGGGGGGGSLIIVSYDEDYVDLTFTGTLHVDGGDAGKLSNGVDTAETSEDYSTGPGIEHAFDQRTRLLSSGSSAKSGDDGFISLPNCPAGYGSYEADGTICGKCPVGRYSNGGESNQCKHCVNAPDHAYYTEKGVTHASCPYTCDAGYSTSSCYTPFQNFIFHDLGIYGIVGCSVALLALIMLPLFFYRYKKIYQWLESEEDIYDWLGTLADPPDSDVQYLAYDEPQSSLAGDEASVRDGEEYDEEADSVSAMRESIDNSTLPSANLPPHDRKNSFPVINPLFPALGQFSGADGDHDAYSDEFTYARSQPEGSSVAASTIASANANRAAASCESKAGDKADVPAASSNSRSWIWSFLCCEAERNKIKKTVDHTSRRRGGGYRDRRMRLRMADGDLQHHACRVYLIGSNHPFDFRGGPWRMPRNRPVALRPMLKRHDYGELADQVTQCVSWNLFSLEMMWFYATILLMPPLSSEYMKIARRRRANRLLKIIAEYDYKCFRCPIQQQQRRSLRISVSPDCTLAYIDFLFDAQMHSEGMKPITPIGQPHLPGAFKIAGLGTYSTPFYVDTNDLILQAVPHTDVPSEFINKAWIEFLVELNTILRTVQLDGLHRGIYELIYFLNNPKSTMHLGGVVVNFCTFTNTVVVPFSEQHHTTTSVSTSVDKYSVEDIRKDRAVAVANDSSGSFMASPSPQSLNSPQVYTENPMTGGSQNGTPNIYSGVGAEQRAGTPLQLNNATGERSSSWDLWILKGREYEESKNTGNSLSKRWVDLSGRVSEQGRPSSNEDFRPSMRLSYLFGGANTSDVRRINSISSKIQEEENGERDDSGTEEEKKTSHKLASAQSFGKHSAGVKSKLFNFMKRWGNFERSSSFAFTDHSGSNLDGRQTILKRFTSCLAGLLQSAWTALVGYYLCLFCRQSRDDVHFTDDPHGFKMSFNEMCYAVKEGKLKMGITVSHPKVASHVYIPNDDDYLSADEEELNQCLQSMDEVGMTEGRRPQIVRQTEPRAISDGSSDSAALVLQQLREGVKRNNDIASVGSVVDDDNEEKDEQDQYGSKRVRQLYGSKAEELARFYNIMRTVDSLPTGDNKSNGEAAHAPIDETYARGEGSSIHSAADLLFTENQVGFRRMDTLDTNCSSDHASIDHFGGSTEFDSRIYPTQPRIVSPAPTSAPSNRTLAYTEFSNSYRSFINPAKHAEEMASTHTNEDVSIASEEESPHSVGNEMQRRIPVDPILNLTSGGIVESKAMKRAVERYSVSSPVPSSTSGSDFPGYVGSTMKQRYWSAHNASPIKIDINSLRHAAQKQYDFNVKEQKRTKRRLLKARTDFAGSAYQQYVNSWHVASFASMRIESDGMMMIRAQSREEARRLNEVLSTKSDTEQVDGKSRGSMGSDSQSDAIDSRDGDQMSINAADGEPIINPLVQKDRKSKSHRQTLEQRVSTIVESAKASNAARESIAAVISTSGPDGAPSPTSFTEATTWKGHDSSGNQEAAHVIVVPDLEALSALTYAAERNEHNLGTDSSAAITNRSSMPSAARADAAGQNDPLGQHNYETPNTYEGKKQWNICTALIDFVESTRANRFFLFYVTRLMLGTNMYPYGPKYIRNALEWLFIIMCIVDLALAAVTLLDSYCASDDATACERHTSFILFLAIWPGAIFIAPLVGLTAMMLGPSGTLSRMYGRWSRLASLNSIVILYSVVRYYSYYNNLPGSIYPLVALPSSRAFQCLFIDLYIAHIETLRYTRGWDGLHTSLFKTKDTDAELY